MQFIEEFKKGQLGQNMGLGMGKGLSAISTAVNGIQKGMIIGFAAAPKVGKSTIVDSGAVIEPYLEALEKGLPLDIIYFSYEIDRVSKEFDFCAFFLSRDFNIRFVKLDGNQRYLGLDVVPMSSKYLRGRLRADDGTLILVKSVILEAVKTVYITRIIPIFGEYSIEGTLLKKGSITFIDFRENPTGVRNWLMKYGDDNGRWIYHHFVNKEGKQDRKPMGWIPRDEAKQTVIVMDHLRKLVTERGWQTKQTVDKMIEYFVEFRNWCNWTIIPIIHLNRSLTNSDRLKMSGDMLYPNGDDIKDTGNFSEECDHLFTMFNPNDERYNLSKHFGLKIKDKDNNLLYPNMRSVHLVESRHVVFPQHFRVNMFGNIKTFEKIVT
jgi:hypothetical protein